MRNTFTRSGSFGLTGVVGSLSFLLLANGGKRASPVLRVYLFGTAVPNRLLFLLGGISFPRLSAHLKERVDDGHLSLVEVYQSVLQQWADLDVEDAKGAQVRA